MKRPRRPSPGRGTRIPAPVDTPFNPNHVPPTFSLQYLHPDYALASCTQEEKAAFADTLWKLSQMTWQQIMQSPRHGRGAEFLDRQGITGAPVPSHITTDVRLIALRFHGKKPMVGYRGKDGVTFFVVFLDRDFTLYSH